MTTVPLRYLPRKLSRQDRKKQAQMLLKSRKMYKTQRKYFTRKKVASFQSHVSPHILAARQRYHIASIVPGKKLAAATGCSLAALKKIVQKGEGAYFSSGSRPNQTAQSWGLARLASAVTGGKAAAVDYAILARGCDPKKPAFRLAEKARATYGHGHGSTRKIKL